MEAVSGRRHTANCGQARTKPDRGHAACAPGARREDFARVDEKTREVACVRTMSRSASVLPSPVAPLGPHMHHMTGRVAESPGRANGGPSQSRTGPSDDATGPDRQSGLRSPAAGGARPRRVWRSTPTDEGVRRRERFWGTEDPCAAKLFRAETTETAPASLLIADQSALCVSDETRTPVVRATLSTNDFNPAPHLRPCCSNSPCCFPP